MQILHPKITVVTVTYMARWHFLSKLVDRVIADEHVANLIIVSNGSANIAEITAAALAHPDRITVLDLEKNLGSAVGFKRGLQEAAKSDSDYVLLLDDDNIPESGFGSIFFQNLNLFTDKELKEKVVLLGNRHVLAHSQEPFSDLPPKNHNYVPTFFTVFSWKKVKNFLKILFRVKRKDSHTYPFLPIIVSESFAYGGTLLPIDAVRRAAFPDERVFTYGDDIVYSWNVKNLGFKTYLCARPFIEDIDISLDAEHHFLAFFKEETHEFKVFFKIRNSAFLSIKYSKHVVVTVLSVYIWLFGLFIIALCKFGPTRLVFKRIGLILKAAYLGITQNFTIPTSVRMPENISLQPNSETRV